MPECPNCGFPMDPAQHARCPKCDSSGAGQTWLGLHEVDVVHSGESWEEAAAKIEKAIDHALRWGHRGVKIVHGYGSASGHSAIAPRAIALLRHFAEQTGGRFAKDRGNPGASILWLNK